MLSIQIAGREQIVKTKIGHPFLFENYIINIFLSEPC